jgi:hypothetical protein
LPAANLMFPFKMLDNKGNIKDTDFLRYSGATCSGRRSTAPGGRRQRGAI